MCILQLSHYLDMVEVQIAKQISTKSEAFFHAMTSHDELQEQLSQTVKVIQHLRSGFLTFVCECVHQEDLLSFPFWVTCHTYAFPFHALPHQQLDK